MNLPIPSYITLVSILAIIGTSKVSSMDLRVYFFFFKRQILLLPVLLHTRNLPSQKGIARPRAILPDRRLTRGEFNKEVP